MSTAATVASDTSPAELERIFELQRAAFAADRYPSLETRSARLGRLIEMMAVHQDRWRAAVAADFDSHHPLVTDLFESGAIIARAAYVLEQLPVWMAPDERPLDPLVHGSSHARVIRQPLGVIGNIAPWNFPIECALVMVVDMLAAGNRVIIKMSEHAPATAKAVQDAVSEYFDEDVLAVATGGTELGERFSDLPWDHLCFTGSTRVGRLVMQAAARNLVPVTLELGGKNPTIFTSDGVTPELIDRFLYCRVFKGGQVCTSPDHAYVPADQLEQWMHLAREAWTALYPDGYVGHDDATGAINDHHFERVMGYVEEARAAGVEVVSLNGDEPDSSRRQVPMYAIVDPPAGLTCMTEEVFGPVTPVVPYHSLDEVVDRINAGPRPLACYVVTRDEEVGRRLETAIHSGGHGVNVFGFQAADPRLPFGGVGFSGTGCHGGQEGFLNFSHSKSVFYAADDDPLLHAIRPPYGPIAQAFSDALFHPPAQ
jgi:coniferyl-aldehyde dehydrogenase